ncbi:hypothetical protein PCASD_13950 [Puccinia coronata f. sp. avenae]|uniref:Uncharacterized protein n=1 Tax=Puccinia coronata f. sp. avenae TaxID=200324 RepID=A0A2N5T2Q2_9BASI|nr:hypothetical protein PCASD_20803 [Puccinia coronata f. sp. avenae]PLW32826.1 hypothetical protein PCASD_13950 [Puccinia coronata f. sp. avenae]
MSLVGSPSSLELNELNWLTELNELGWVPAGTCHLYAGTCHLYAGTCHLYAGTCHLYAGTCHLYAGTCHLYAGTCHLYAGTCWRKCGLRKDKDTQEAAKELAARKPKKPIAAPKESWLHG